MLRKILSAFTIVTLAAIALAQANPGTTVRELPGENVFPEGIALGPDGDTFYVGSAMTGAIYRGEVAGGDVTEFVAGGEEPFTTLGMAVDEEGRLWVAGGGSGEVRRYDTESGELVDALQTPETEATLLNDVALDSAGNAYITDSTRPVLFRVASGSDRVEPWIDLTDTAFSYGEGANANGIVVTDDDRYVLVVALNSGRLYRVDTETAELTEVALAGGPLPGSDGLVLDGQTLYAVRQPSDKISVVEMGDDFATGRVVAGTIQHDSFAEPATAALAGERLLVVNTQFDAVNGEPSLPFTVTSILLTW